MRNKNDSGFVLLEIILAIALFSFVATAMVVALDRLAMTSTTAQKESRIFRRMESVMTEYSWRAGTGQTSIPAEESGVSVDIIITPESYTSINGVSLNDMYKIHLTGRLDAEPGIERNLERIVYSPKNP